MKIARAYHYLKYGKYHEYRKAQYLHHFDELIHILSEITGIEK
jgi:hypothetical protein